MNAIERAIKARKTMERAAGKYAIEYILTYRAVPDVSGFLIGGQYPTSLRSLVALSSVKKESRNAALCFLNEKNIS